MHMAKQKAPKEFLLSNDMNETQHEMRNASQ